MNRVNDGGGPVEKRLQRWTNRLAVGARPGVATPDRGHPSRLDAQAGLAALAGAAVCILMALFAGQALIAAISPSDGSQGAAAPHGAAGRAPYRPVGSNGRFNAANPAQHLELGFTRSGVLTAGSRISTRLSVKSIDYGRGARRLGSVAPVLAANRVLYLRPAVTEWYANGPAGLEQGFTIAAPTHGAAGVNISLAISLAGNAHASLAAGGASMILSRPGARSLSYGSLRAVDAHGRTLQTRLELRGQTLRLLVDGRGASYPVRIDPLLATSPTLASPAGAGGRFGSGIALSGNGTTAIVGAPLDGPGGTAWIYVRSGPNWSRQGPTLSGLEKPEPCVPEGAQEAELCRFGVAAALSGSGNTALIGAPIANGGEGGARIYTRAGTAWSVGPALHAEGVSGTGHFGRSVALSADGNTALVGEPFEEGGHGAAWVFYRSGWSWPFGAELRGEGESGPAYFGRSVALSADGSTAVISGPFDHSRAGAGWVFTRSSSGWAQQGAKLTAEVPTENEQFGYSVALSSSGSTALFGAPNYNEKAGAAYVFSRSASTWSQQGAPLTANGPAPHSRLGTSVSLSGDGERALAGAATYNNGDGAVREFTHAAGWSEKTNWLIGTEAHLHGRLGSSVALSSDGTTALAGAPNLEEETGDAWSLFEMPYPTPAVKAVEPAEGPTAGATRVTIKGSGFLPGATVTIGKPAGEVEVVSETEIKATTAAAPVAGPSEVVVTDAGGSSTAGPAFTFVASKKEEPPKEEPKGTTTPSGGTLNSIETNVAPPKLGQTGNLDPVQGKVKVKLPGSTTFTSIDTIVQVPFGTTIDATGGTVTVTTAGASGGTQHVDLYAGTFKLLQKTNADVLAVLEGGSFASCPSRHKSKPADTDEAFTAASRKRVVRKLWASGHGNYTTKGHYAAGAVIGTKWLTVDRCDGTLIYVETDAVSVTNLRTHRKVLVKTHHRYFVAAP